MKSRSPRSPHSLWTGKLLSREGTRLATTTSSAQASYAPELRALRAFSFDIIPPVVTLLSTIALWSTPYILAERGPYARLKILASVALCMFVRYEVNERKLGFIGSMYPEDQRSFYACVVVFRLFSLLLYHACCQDVREAENVRRNRDASTRTDGAQRQRVSAGLAWGLAMPYYKLTFPSCSQVTIGYDLKDSKRGLTKDEA